MIHKFQYYNTVDKIVGKKLPFITIRTAEGTDPRTTTTVKKKLQIL